MQNMQNMIKKKFKPWSQHKCILRLEKKLHMHFTVVRKYLDRPCVICCVDTLQGPFTLKLYFVWLNRQVGKSLMQKSQHRLRRTMETQSSNSSYCNKESICVT